MGAALQIDWEPIKQAYIAGISRTSIAERFSINVRTLDKAAERGRWPSPDRIKVQIKRTRQNAQESQETARQHVSSNPDLKCLSQGVAESSQDTLDGLDLTAQSVASGVSRAFAGYATKGSVALTTFARQMLAPKSHKEALTLITGICKVTGLDKQQASGPDRGTSGWQARPRTKSTCKAVEIVDCETVAEDEE